MIERLLPTITLCLAASLSHLLSGCSSHGVTLPGPKEMVDSSFLENRLEPSLRLADADHVDPAAKEEGFHCTTSGKTLDTSRIPNLDISFIEADLREALLEISMLVDLPIVADESVAGLISVNLSGRSLDTALAVLLAPGNYGFKKFEDFIFVGSQAIGSSALNLLSNTCRFKPRHMEAVQLMELINPRYREFITFNEMDNLMSVTAPAAIQKRIQEDLILLDIAPAQVLLEVSIVEVSQDVMEILGVNWKNLNIIEQGMDFLIAKALLDNGDGVQNNYNYGQTTLGNNRRGVGLQSFRNLIGLLKDRGMADIKAMPSIITLDGRVATFSSTATIWLGDKSTSGRSKQLVYGVNLELTPYISSGSKIRLNIARASVSDLTFTTSGEPVLISHSIANSVEVADGDMLVLGGLLQKKSRSSRSKVPGLSWLIGLKKLFSQDTKQVHETEVLIVIRPTILS